MNEEQKILLETYPGLILLEEFMKPYQITAARLSRDTGLSESRLSNIISGKRRITAETAIALGAFFSMEAQFWMNLQSEYDFRCEEIEHGDVLRTRVRPLHVA